MVWAAEPSHILASTPSWFSIKPCKSRGSCLVSSLFFCYVVFLFILRPSFFAKSCSSRLIDFFSYLLRLWAPESLFEVSFLFRLTDRMVLLRLGTCIITWMDLDRLRSSSSVSSASPNSPVFQMFFVIGSDDFPSLCLDSTLGSRLRPCSWTAPMNYYTISCLLTFMWMTLWACLLES